MTELMTFSPAASATPSTADLTLLGLHSRLGDKPLKFGLVFPQTGLAAVLKGSRGYWHAFLVRNTAVRCLVQRKDMPDTHARRCLLV